MEAGVEMSRSVASGNVPPYNLNSLRNSQTHLNRGGHTAAQSSPLRGECDLCDAFRAVRTEHTTPDPSSASGPVDKLLTGGTDRY